MAPSPYLSWPLFKGVIMGVRHGFYKGGIPMRVEARMYWKPFHEPVLHLYDQTMGKIRGRKLRIKTYIDVQCNGCMEISSLGYGAMQDMMFRKQGLTGYCAYTRKQETLHAVSSDIYCHPKPKQNVKYMALDI